MVDQFKARVRFESPDQDGVWPLAEYVVDYVSRSLTSLDAYARRPRSSLRAANGSVIERDDIPTLRVAAREHHLEPDVVHAGFVVKRGVVPPASDNEIEHIRFSIEVDLYPDLTVDV